MNQKQHSLLMRGMSAFAAALAVMLAVGALADYQIAQAIYAPDNPLVIFFSSLGLIPMAYPISFLAGVLAQRCLASQKPQALRIAGAILCFALAMLVGALATKALLSVRDGFSGIFGNEPPPRLSAWASASSSAAACARWASAPARRTTPKTSRAACS